MNVIVTQQPSAERAELAIPNDQSLRKTVRLQADIGETTKQRVRRLAMHCNAFRGSDSRQALWQLASTLVPLALLIAAMFATVRSAYWATLLLALPAGGLLVRAFIIQHDCGHGSFFPSQKLNEFTGRCVSLLTVTPYNLWKREHAQHHATSGNLDRRGSGDIDTLTVEEYLSLSTFGKLRYRIYRNPLFLFGFGVPFYFVAIQRLPWLHAIAAREAWKSVIGLNLGLVVFYGLLAYFFGLSDVLMVMLPIVHVAAAVGGWLFFIQHQFADTTWERTEGWDFQVAALLGSSFYDLPKILTWITGNIGVHHIHHLNSMIPNYKLQGCLEKSPELKDINRLTLRDSLKCASLKLWDGKRNRLIRFDEIERAG